jgi:hypothetical protein
MAIEKVTSNFLSHEPEKNLYSRFLNDTINGIRDAGALGIYIYLGSKHEGWEIIESQLMSHFGKGRDFIRNAFKYLKSLGLIEKIPQRDQFGHITSWTTNLKRQITEIPSSGDIQITEIPTSGKTHLLENPSYINNRYIQIKEKELEIKDLTSTTEKQEEVEVVISLELDKKIISERPTNPNDKRSDKEFLRQCFHHLQFGDNENYTQRQRVAGLMTMVRKGTFETPASYSQKIKQQTQKEGADLKSRYQLYASEFNGRKIHGQIPKDEEMLSYQEWLIQRLKNTQMEPC